MSKVRATDRNSTKEPRVSSSHFLQERNQKPTLSERVKERPQVIGTGFVA
jgi:hypothetical protein